MHVTSTYLSSYGDKFVTIKKIGWVVYSGRLETYLI